MRLADRLLRQRFSGVRVRLAGDLLNDMSLPLLLLAVLVVSLGIVALLVISRNPGLRTIPVAERLVYLFFTVGLVYPVLRYELMSHYRLPSPVVGVWQDLAVLLILVVLLVGPRRPLPVSEKSVWGVSAILLCGVVSSWISPDWVLSLYGARLTYLPMTFFAIGLMLPASSGLVRRIAWYVANLAGLSALFGLTLTYGFPAYWLDVIAFSSQERGWGQDAFARAGGYRMTGTLIDPVSFGFLSALGVISYTCLSFRAKSWARWGAAAGAILSLATCGLSLTRGAWLMVAVGMTITALLAIRNWTHLAKAGMALILISTGLWFAAPEHMVSQAEERLGLTWERTITEGNSQREQMWNDAIDGFFRNPLGFGLGAVGHMAGRFPGRLRPETPLVTDGWYFKLAAEGGAPLVVSFVLFQGVLLLTLWGRLRRAVDSDQRSLVIIVGSVFAGASAMAIGCNLWDLYFASHLMWFLAGLGVRPDTLPVLRPYIRMRLRPYPAH